MNNLIFTYPIIIKESHLDTFGHMNNAMYLTLFEEARWEFITQNGYGFHKIKSTGLGPIILEIKLTFLKEILLREQIIIETSLISYDKKIGKLIQQMKREGETCCTAEITFGLFDTHARKLILPTDEWLKAIGAQTN